MQTQIQKEISQIRSLVSQQASIGNEILKLLGSRPRGLAALSPEARSEAGRKAARTRKHRVAGRKAAKT
jgi:hypothetical protein